MLHKFWNSLAAKLPHSQRARAVWLLIFTQTVCVAAGLRIHDLLVDYQIESLGHSHAWAELDRHRPELIERLRVADASVRDLEAPLPPAVRGTGDGREPAISVVDSKWQILATNGHLKPGEHLEWSPLPEASWDAQTPSRGGQMGMVQRSKEVELAVVYPRPQNAGFIVVHRPQTMVTVNPQEVAKSIFLLSLMTFAWTAGLLWTVSYMVVARLHEEFCQQRLQSETEALRRVDAMSRMRDAIIFGLAKLTESRDAATGYHLERIALFSSRLALALRRNPKYRAVITSEFIRLLETSSTLHDIGKVGIEDAVLLKRGPLDREERAKMQLHAVIGGQCIQDIERRLGSSNFLQMAREIALWHHEHWDGSGYPNGLAEEEIPLSARIVAVADVYEALASERVYKKALPHEKCVAYIRAHAGKHFDPDVVDAFLEIEGQFREILQQYPVMPNAAEVAAEEALPASQPVSPPGIDDHVAGLPLVTTTALPLDFREGTVAD